MAAQIAAEKTDVRNFTRDIIKESAKFEKMYILFFQANVMAVKTMTKWQLVI